MTASLNRRQAEAILPMLRAAMGGVEMRARDDAVGFYLRETLFAIVQDGVLWFRVDARTRDAYDRAEAGPGGADDSEDDGEEPGAGAPDPFGPPGGGGLGQASFRRLPAFVLNDEDTLADWGRKAWEAARRARGASYG